jgi:tRNA A37 threonylcarbamoyladenosine modification protein TsaB
MIKVNKAINLEQLDKELNGKGLVATVSDDKKTVLEVGLASDNDASIEELIEAVKAHKAVFVEPSVEEKLASVGLNLNDLKTALGI